MTEFETPIMRDIEKLFTPILIGIILAIVLVFSIMPLNGVYHSLLWELEQFDKGFTWEDKQRNGCFEREEGITFYDKYRQKELTVNSACSSNALPWETISWSVPLIIGLIIANIVLYRKRHPSVRETK